MSNDSIKQYEESGLDGLVKSFLPKILLPFKLPHSAIKKILIGI